MKLIVGLGNPGHEYSKTRHNIGYIMIDLILKELKLEINQNKFNGIFIKTNKCIFAKPCTYMNLSGDFILKIMNYYKINIDDILIIYDDMDQDIGRFKIKHSGGPGGHNGIKNIIKNLNTLDVNRIQIGIGRGVVGKKHVLSNFLESEKKIMNGEINKCLKASIDFIDYNINYIMNKYNRKR